MWARLKPRITLYCGWRHDCARPASVGSGFGSGSGCAQTQLRSSTRRYWYLVFSNIAHRTERSPRARSRLRSDWIQLQLVSGSLRMWHPLTCTTQWYRHSVILSFWSSVVFCSIVQTVTAARRAMPGCTAYAAAPRCTAPPPAASVRSEMESDDLCPVGLFAGR